MFFIVYLWVIIYNFLFFLLLGEKCGEICFVIVWVFFKKISLCNKSKGLYRRGIMETYGDCKFE